MPRKRKKKVFSAAKVVREMARERVGSPKPSQLVRAKKSKPERHKPTLGKLLTDELAPGSHSNVAETLAPPTGTVTVQVLPEEDVQPVQLTKL